MTLTKLTQSDIDAATKKTSLEAEEKTLLASLASTDWYIARFAETGKEIPAEIATERQAARDRISVIRTEIGS